jgi:hypothetical protein
VHTVNLCGPWVILAAWLVTAAEDSISRGSCAAGQTLWGGGQPGVCGSSMCVPKTCASKGGAPDGAGFRTAGRPKTDARRNAQSAAEVTQFDARRPDLTQLHSVLCARSVFHSCRGAFHKASRTPAIPSAHHLGIEFEDSTAEIDPPKLLKLSTLF